VGTSCFQWRSCRVNSRRLCWPISLGGLGIQDLKGTGMALGLCWQWLDQTDENRAWRGLHLQFTAEERDLFFASTIMRLGNNQMAKFWEDRWIAGRQFAKLPPSILLHPQTPPQAEDGRRRPTSNPLGTRHPRCHRHRRD
jgi:hypothetical protein